MNVVDVLILAALLLATVEGWRAGFIATVYGLATWLFGLAVAIFAHPPLAAVIASVASWPPAVARSLAFILILLAVEGVFALAGRFTLAPLLRAVRAHHVMGVVDRLAGVVPSVARMVVIIAVSLAALVVFPIAPGVRQAIDGSRFGSALVLEVAALQPRLEQLIGGGDDEGLLLVTKLSADQQQRLQLPGDLSLAPDPEAERQLFDLVNRERGSRGLKPLQQDPRLVPVARAHAEEMFRLKYFGHVSPNTGTPFDRLSKAGILYQRAGENLAYAQSVAVAHTGLMESAAHRENILRPEFTNLGVGVVSAGLYGRMFVQLFLTP